MRNLYKATVKNKLGHKLFLLMGLFFGLSITYCEAQTSYCIPEFVGGCASGEQIDDFSLSGVNGTSIDDEGTGCSFGAYDNRTDESVDLRQGDAYTSYVKAHGSDSACAIWIDLDDSGSFEEGELIGISTSNLADGTLSPIDIDIPATAELGSHRMRVMVGFHYSGPIDFDPCNGGPLSVGGGEVHDYSVAILSMEECDGTPAAGTVEDDFSVCSGSPFTLSVSGATQALGGLQYNWQSSPAGFAQWTSIEGADSPSYEMTEGIQESTDFRLKVTCTNSGQSDFSDILSVGLSTSIECYCVPEFLTGCDSGDMIDTFTLTGENNTAIDDQNTGCSDGAYDDRTDKSASLMPGSTYIANITTQAAGDQCAIWIDFNDDGIFQESERVGTASTMGNGTPQEVDFSIPLTTTNQGQHRMRVMVAYNYNGNPENPEVFAPCNDGNSPRTYGEVHDYSVTILELEECGGIPDAGTLDAGFAVCAGETFTLSVSNATGQIPGIEYVWQSSPTGQNDWTDLEETNNTSITIEEGIEENTDFRFKITCTASSETAFSNLQTITLNPLDECYCIPEFPEGCSDGHYIQEFVLTGEDDTEIHDLGMSCSENSYDDRTDESVDLKQGFTYSVEIYKGNPSSDKFAIWIDFNDDGTFDDTELVGSYNSGSYTIGASTDINIPETANMGPHRMRTMLGASTEMNGDEYNACNLGLIINQKGDVIDYTVNITELDVCTGTPDAGAVSESSLEVCARDVFTISVTGASPEVDNLEHIWQSSPAGDNTWEDIPNAHDPTYTVVYGIEDPTDFRYKVTCTTSGETDFSEVIQVSLNPDEECYCIPSFNLSCDIFKTNIDDFILTGENDTSIEDYNTGCSQDSYDSRIDESVDLAPGVVYTAEMTTENTNARVAIWIDFDDNMTFDTDELVGTFVNLSTVAESSVEINIPETAAAGQHRMRVMVGRSGIPSDPDYYSPCNDGSSPRSMGEVHDYMVNILSLEDCEGTPTAGIAEDDFNVCENQSFTLSVSGASSPANGLEGHWQSSSDGQEPWTNIEGAGNPEFVLEEGIDEPTYFRFKMTCLNSNETDISTTISVDLKPAEECICTPIFIYGCSDSTTLLNLDGVNNTSIHDETECSEDGYTDNTDQSVSLYPGDNYTLEINMNSSPNNCAVWIDFENNGSFEFVGTKSEMGFEDEVEIQIPQEAEPGDYRMRIMVSHGGNPEQYTPCNDNYSPQNYGEARDYTVNILELEECDGIPSVGTTTEDFSICADTPFSISVSGASETALGLERIWQSSPAGENNWTNLEGEGFTIYNAEDGIGESTDFRYKITCSNSDETVFSAIIEVSVKPGNQCYCVPNFSNVVGCGLGDEIDDFMLTGENGTEIQNLNSGCSEGSYDDRTDESVDLQEMVDYTVKLSTQVYGSDQCAIWIDFNDNGVFEDSEIVGTASNLVSNELTEIPISIPEGVTAGPRRMRVMVGRKDSPDELDPCNNSPHATYGEVHDYTANIIETEPCSGTPNAGTPDESTLEVCAGKPFILKVNNAAGPAYGLSRIWQSSPAGENNWTNIAEATSRTYTVEDGVLEPTNFRYKATCANGGETDVSDIIAVDITMGEDCYCIPQYSLYTSCNESAIVNVALQGESNILDNDSGCTVGGYGYEDYTGLTAPDLIPGQTYTLSVTLSNPFADDFLKAWIDYNNNGSFENEEEIVDTGDNPINSIDPQTFEFTVPEDVNLGSVRLRVRMVTFTSDFDACQEEIKGETEDYELDIIDLENCSGTVTAGSPDTNTLDICSGEAFTLHVSNTSEPANGLIRIWQSSPAGENEWADIDGATQNTLNLPEGLGESKDFRFKVTCNNSNETDISEIVQVTLKPVMECYCIPGNEEGNVETYIDGFTTSGGEQNIANENQGMPDGIYSDFTNMTVSQYIGDQISFSADLAGQEGGFRIWVDWNQDGVFDPDNEVAYMSSGFALSHSGTITVPEGAETGTTRMRIVSDPISYDGSLSDPCMSYSDGREFEDYSFEVIPLDGCTGTPSAGTPDVSSFSVCSGYPLTLSVSGASDISGGLLRIWQSSPTGENNWTAIEGEYSPDLVLEEGIEIATDFRYKVTCMASGQSDASAVIEVSLNPENECYCVPEYYVDCTYGDEINNVTLVGETVTLNNDSDCSDNGFGDYTDLTPPDLKSGNTYTLSVYSSGSATYKNIKAWVDFNKNGAFEEDEIIAATLGDGLDESGTSNFDFTLQEGLMPGEYGMRIRLAYNVEVPDACSMITYGEAEDYRIEIIELEDCENANAGVPEDDFDVCSGSSFSLSVTGASEPTNGLERIWQSSPDGQTSWIDIPGAVPPTYTVEDGILNTTYYRYKVTCALIGESEISDPIKVSIKLSTECYCTPSYSIVYPITQVDLKDENGNTIIYQESPNKDENPPAYEDFTNVVGQVEQGETYTLTVEGNSNPFTSKITVYIDWNQDGIFSTDQADGEMYYLPDLIDTDGNDGTQSTAQIEIPIASLAGMTRMRVTEKLDEPSGPCNMFGFGQAEDYLLEVTEGSGICGAPFDFSLGYITDHSVTIYWTSNSDEWDIAYGDPGFNPDNGEGTIIGNITDNPYILTGLDINTNYDVYVRAVCDENGKSEWTGPKEFNTTLPVCEDPENIAINGITDSSAEVIWTAGGSETQWEVIYGEAGFTPDTEDEVIPVNGTPETTLASLDPDTEYDVYVRAICDENSQSDWIGPVSFNTELDIANQVFENFTYYPNPVNNELTLKAGNQIESVIVYNLLGQTVISENPNQLQTQLNTERLQSGVYLMKVTINGSVKTFRVVKK